VGLNNHPLPNGWSNAGLTLGRDLRLAQPVLGSPAGAAPPSSSSHRASPSPGSAAAGAAGPGDGGAHGLAPPPAGPGPPGRGLRAGSEGVSTRGGSSGAVARGAAPSPSAEFGAVAAAEQPHPAPAPAEQGRATSALGGGDGAIVTQEPPPPRPYSLPELTHSSPSRYSRAQPEPHFGVGQHGYVAQRSGRGRGAGAGTAHVRRQPPLSTKAQRHRSAPAVPCVFFGWVGWPGSELA
jgi:hypothetical protein